MKKKVELQKKVKKERNPGDFCLWKIADTSEPGFETNDAYIPYGFPGWHIECSGMAHKYLGENFDIHTGGIDLLFPHHTNEIAQSENCFEKVFSNFFCHNAFIDISNEKMSKSKNNFHTLNFIIENNFHPLAYRYLILQTHYRQNLNFTLEGLQASENALNKLRKQVCALIPPLSKGGQGDFFKKLSNFPLHLPLKNRCKGIPLNPGTVPAAVYSATMCCIP